jgi:CheY-like chemotaxis protein
VEDSGEGIAPEFLPHMFETFRQSDTSTTRPHGGLGIGLSIVKHLVELHGGHIEGRSPGKGQGATFVVRLPVSPLISATLGVKKVAARRPLPDRPAPPRLEGVRALVVEDDPDAQELLSHVLSESGIAVRAAGSAEEARHILDTYEPHVIISDVGLPGEDGHEFIRSIRTSSIEARKNIPALALTAFASNEDRARALVAGFNNHLAKPVDAGTLIAAIIELTGRAGRS